MASFTAGSKARASAIPAPYILQAACNLALAQTSLTPADIPNAFVTFSTVHANATAQIFGVFDVTSTVASSAAALGLCYADGVAQAGEGIWVLSTAGARATVMQQWTVPLPATGPHTIKLRAMLSAASGTATYSQTHTTITALILDY